MCLRIGLKNRNKRKPALSRVRNKNEFSYFKGKARMRIIRILGMLMVLATLFLACQNDQGPQAGKATINGIISDASTHAPLPGLSVEARIANQAPVTKTTDANGAYEDRKSTRLNSSHIQKSRMPSSA